MLNIGGYYIKENRMGTFGYLSAWTFSEDEEACAQLSSGSTTGFAALSGSNLALSLNAAVAATAKINIKQSNGSKTLVITKKTANTVVITYI